MYPDNLYYADMLERIIKFIAAQLKYMSYVNLHKYFVLRECIYRGVIWRGIVHDISKFRPSEWFAYSKYFYSGTKDPGEIAKSKFDKAWLMHQKRNPHHWQYWMLQNDEDGVNVLPMPEEYIIEMVCDWIGAGKALGKGSPEQVIEWYTTNKDKMSLHPNTRMKVELMIGYKK